MASDKNLQELFHDTLKDIYFAEKTILSAHPEACISPSSLVAGKWLGPWVRKN